MKHPRLELALVLVCLCALSGAATWFTARSGWTLYYGDAESHLDIARRIVDSRTPGYEQFGTVWLPLPHLLTLALVRDDAMWRNGLAGAIPTSISFVIAGMFLFAAVRRATQSSGAAIASLAFLAINPNLLYLQATPMTEPILLAGLMGTLYFTIRFRQNPSFGSAAGAAVATLAATLARYEGWFLIPFVTIYFLVAGRRRRFVYALLFGAIASLGPLYWLAHNQFFYSNPLEFYNGPYSAKAIYERALRQGMVRYAGDHDWRQSARYYASTAQLAAGWVAVAAGVIGAVGLALRRVFWPLILTALPPVFYVWSMYSGGTPIFVPQLWPNTYYNTRYGLAVLPLLAFAAAGLVLWTAPRWRSYIATAAVLAAAIPWLIHPEPGQWICWKESQVNSEARRAWTAAAANVLAKEYQPGSGIFTSLGDVAGILREARIPIREALQEGNQRDWLAATARPDLFLHEEWALAMSGDSVATAVQKATFKGHPRYDLVQTVKIRGAPVIEIYKRD